jgi:hypothetical protein
MSSIDITNNTLDTRLLNQRGRRTLRQPITLP